MTQQIPHWVFYKWRRYELVSWFPQMRNWLEELGVKPQIFSTACRRGYVAEYKIESNQLFLTRLKVAELSGSKQDINEALPSLIVKFPPIGNVRPTKKFAGFSYSVQVSDGKGEFVRDYDIVYSLRHLCLVSGSIVIIRGRYKRPPQYTIHPQTLRVTLERGYIKGIKDITREVMISKRYD